jgi:hypothetical protein
MTERWLTLLLVIGIIGSCSPNRPPEVHLVPAGYQGPLLVLYNQAGYPSLSRSGDSLVFDFRLSNVLRTSSALVTGSGPVSAFQYYYVGPTGQRARIRKVADWPELQQYPPDEPCLVITAGSVYASGAVSEFVTSARNFDRNEKLSDRLTDSLVHGDTVSAPYKMP